MELRERRIIFPTARSGATQAAVFKNFHTKYIGWSAGYRGGKTYTIARKAVALAYLNFHYGPVPFFGMVTEPTAGMVRDILVPAFEEFLYSEGIPFETSGSPGGNSYEIFLPEANFTILFRSADKPSRLAGTTLCFFIMDEAGQCKLEAWRKGASRVSEKRARVLQAIAVGTPEGLGWFYERFGMEPRANTDYYCSPTSENEQNLPDGYAAELLDSYDPQTFKSYGLGQFVNTTSDSVFGDLFLRSECVFPLPLPKPGTELIWGMDFNVDPMAACVITLRDDGDPDVVDELVVRSTYTDKFILAMQERYPFDKYPDQTVCCDPTGTRRQTSAGGRTDVAILKEAGYEVKWSRVKIERDPINETRRMILDAKGRRRMRVAERCHKVISSLEAWAYKPGSLTTKEEEYRTSERLWFVPHVADSVKYPMHTLFPIRRPGVSIQEPPSRRGH